jgi:subtilisin family serine protease
MTTKIARFILPVAFNLMATAAWCQQQAMLVPPDNHYFLGKGSWGQGYADQWGLQRIGFDASDQSAWRLVKQNAQPVTVALIDTGLDWNHRNIDPENLWRNPAPGVAKAGDGAANAYTGDAIGWDFFDRDNKPWDNDGHGTFVAGIIAGSWKDKDGVAGINPLARLMVLKAVNNFGHSRASYIAEAIAYAADHGARVINLSVGGKGSTKVEQAAIDYAYGKGVVIVVAAGNEGAEISNYGIANSDKVLTVATTGLDDKRANFSNWGKIAVAAPGIDILSLRARRTDTLLGIPGVKYAAGAGYVGDDKRYYRASGTSFSAPMVSGLASLLIANDPTLTNRQVMNIIKSTARDVGTPGVDQYTGYGIIDARAALAAPKDYALLAGISRVEVVQKGGSQIVRVRGLADANAFKAARIEVGAGDSPTTWTVIGPAKQSPEADGVLGEIPAAAFKGSSVWQVRLVVSHGNGATREARFKLSLG